MYINHLKKLLFLFIFISSTALFLNCSTDQNDTNSNEGAIEHPAWSKSAAIYEVNLRQHTPEGTFKAFEEHLPRLKAMGIDIIWLMPIHPIGQLNRKGTLGSYYSVLDYKAVNPEHGTLDDLKDLVEAAHDLDMYLIIDWVANHTAWDNVWTISHPEFFKKDSNGNFYPPVADWSDVIALDFNNKELWNYMIDAMKYWVEECDIDGYRCDVASQVPVDFWNRARLELDRIKPVFMLAEATEVELHEKAFDMTYSWPLKDLMNAIARGDKNAIDLAELFRQEKITYPADAYRMNFVTNHDENSWNGTAFERLGNGTETFTVLCTLIKGMPLVYSGQEAGLNKALPFFEKSEIDWKEHKFRELFTKLFQLKEDNRALWNGVEGGEMEIISGDNAYVFSFTREKQDDKIFAVFNLSHSKQEVSLTHSNINDTFIDFFDEDTVVEFQEETGFQLDPWKYILYVKKN